MRKRRNKTGRAAIPVCMVIVVAWTCASCGHDRKSSVIVDASAGLDGGSLGNERPVPPFVGGVMVHNGLEVFTRDELRQGRGRGVALFDPGGEDSPPLGNGTEDDWEVRSLAWQDSAEGQCLWVGTLFDGAYQVDLKSGKVIEHFTVESTGIIGTARVAGDDELVFEPQRQMSSRDVERIESMLETGLYLRFNTETFQVRSIDWPGFKVYTYASHDLPHSALPSGGDRVVIESGLPDNTINDVMVEGDTVWFAAGLFGDKGMAGGVAAYRGERFFSRYADVVFNRVRRFNWQRSNAALSLARSGAGLWSGWAEIRGLKLWGGVSGNLLDFVGDGADRKQWRDFTGPIGVNREGYAPVLHTSVPALAPVELARGGTVESCVAAATFSVNNALHGMGWPGRHAYGGGGLRVICEGGLKALIVKSFGKDGKPTAGSPPSNAVFSVTAGKIGKTGLTYAIAGTDAGLYFVELSSRIREYFYQPPKNPAEAILVGSLYSKGVMRKSEVLHGMTVGSDSWPACLPDLFVQDVYIQDELSSDTTSTVWVGTYRGLARYSGPIAAGEIGDCGRWTWWPVWHEEGIGTRVGLPVKAGERFESRPGRELLPVSAIEPVDVGGRKLLAIGTGDKWRTMADGAGLIDVESRSEARFKERALTHARVHYSSVYENLQETVIFPDAAVINLYTARFNAKPCSIETPSCLVGDTALNWTHFDAMLDGMLDADLTPTLCIASFPELMYEGFTGPGKCSPPDPSLPECSPSRAGWDMRRWENMVFAMTDHLYRRYGRARVGGWAIEVWNEPGLVWMWPWHQSFANDYAILLSSAERAARAADTWWDRERPSTAGSRLRIAGPAWHGDPKPAGRDLTETLAAMKEKGGKPDTLTVHVYPYVRMDMTPYLEAVAAVEKSAGMNAPVEVTEYGAVMALSHDGIGASASSEVPALALIESVDGLYRTGMTPSMMYMTDVQSMFTGSRSNWPGFVDYLGTTSVAPRPIFNLAALAAQAGDLAVGTSTSGPVRAFGRLDLHTGKIMVFAYRVRTEAPWKETKNYLELDPVSVAFSLSGLGRGPYRVREFRIDSAHSNLLTALWRAGSPEQPSPEIARRIVEDALLKPLQGGERVFPDRVAGGSVRADASMEADSIYVVELTPPPVVATSGSTVTGLRVKVDKDGRVSVDWRDSAGPHAVKYSMTERAWKSMAVDDSIEDGGCSFTVRINASEAVMALAGGEAPALHAESGGFESVEDIPLEDWNGRDIACASDDSGSVHVVYGVTAGGAKLVYRSWRPILDETPAGGRIRWAGGRMRPVSAFGPYQSPSPRSPAIAVGRDALYVVWIEDNPAAMDADGRQAIVYAWLRR